MTSGFIIKEQGKNLIIELAAPNLDKEEIKVFVQGDYLKVEGKRELSKEARAKGFYAKEEKSSKFLEQISLPVNVKGNEAKTEFLDGKLRIIIPKQD